MPEPLPPKHHEPPIPPPPRHEIPPHILKEIMDLKEKVGKLEGMMEMLIKKRE